MEMIPKVVQAVAGKDYSVYAYFQDGTIHLLNALPLVQRGGVFSPLQDTNFFRERLTVINGLKSFFIIPEYALKPE